MGNDKRPPVFGEGAVITKRVRVDVDSDESSKGLHNTTPRVRKEVIISNPFLGSDFASGLDPITKNRAVCLHSNALSDAEMRRSRQTAQVRRVDPDEGLSRSKNANLPTEVQSKQLRSLSSAPFRSMPPPATNKKNVPFHALPLPLPQDMLNSAITASTSSSSLGLKPLSAPNFDIGAPRKVLRTVTALDQPAFEIPDGASGERPEDVAKELNRGLFISPRKSSGRRRGFVRGGLAELAHHIANKTSTSFTLWQREVERDMSVGTCSSSVVSIKSTKPLSRLRYDARIRIRDVHHISHANARDCATGTIWSVLAECSVLDVTEPAMLRIGRSQLDEGQISTCCILFSFSLSHQASDQRSQKQEILRDDAEVLLWKPLLEVDTASGTILLCSTFLVLSA